MSEGARTASKGRSLSLKRSAEISIILPSKGFSTQFSTSFDVNAYYSVTVRSVEYSPSSAYFKLTGATT